MNWVPRDCNIQSQIDYPCVYIVQNNTHRWLRGHLCHNLNIRLVNCALMRMLTKKVLQPGMTLWSTTFKYYFDIQSCIQWLSGYVQFKKYRHFTLIITVKAKKILRLKAREKFQISCGMLFFFLTLDFSVNHNRWTIISGGWYSGSGGNCNPSKTHQFWQIWFWYMVN